MKVVIINKSDSTGGAAVVSLRLMNALRDAGIDARMLVAEKLGDSPFVELADTQVSIKRAFMAERLKIFMANGMNRQTLFRIDTASDGLPLWRHRRVREADVICLGWVNQGMLSFRGLRKLVETGKPVVWTMHDMWNLTGICHHAGDCMRYASSCGDCPLLGSRSAPDDLSARIWARKKELYGFQGIRFVAVSRWLREKAACSSLLSSRLPEVIPNPFPLDMTSGGDRRRSDGKICILIGAARLDDPVKGLPVLVEATRVLADEYPEEAAGLKLVTFGEVKNPDALRGFGIAHLHLGRIEGREALAATYAGADIVVSSSLYETLPGTLVEAQACGCVPVGFDRGGQRDIIDDGSTGVLVEFGNTPREAACNLAEGIIRGIRLSADPDVRRRMRRSVEERFSSEAVARKYIALFENMLGSDHDVPLR